MPARRKPARKAVRRKAAPKRKKVAAKRKAAPKKKTAARKPAAAPPTTPSAIGAVNHHLDYTTHDIEGVKRFYTHLLGFSKFSEDPQFNYLWIETSQGSSLGFMPPMKEMGEPSPAKEPVLYFMVKDVDRAYSNLSSKGVMFEGPPADMPWGHRVVRTSDPEGRSVMLATPKRRP
jgi:predicted enzyme related to lactoylglutathione lyase